MTMELYPNYLQQESTQYIHINESQPNDAGFDCLSTMQLDQSVFNLLGMITGILNLPEMHECYFKNAPSINYAS